jgi:hypothetical protein
MSEKAFDREDRKGSHKERKENHYQNAFLRALCENLANFAVKSFFKTKPIACRPESQCDAACNDHGREEFHTSRAAAS